MSVCATITISLSLRALQIRKHTLPALCRLWTICHSIGSSATLPRRAPTWLRPFSPPPSSLLIYSPSAALSRSFFVLHVCYANQVGQPSLFRNEWVACWLVDLASKVFPGEIDTIAPYSFARDSLCVSSLGKFSLSSALIESLGTLATQFMW